MKHVRDAIGTVALGILIVLPLSANATETVRIGTRVVVGHQELSGDGPPDQEMYLDTGSRPLSI